MNNIFTSPLIVSFASLEQDLASRGRKRLLSQFGSQFPQQKELDEYESEQMEYYLSQGLTQNEAEMAAKADLAWAVRQIAAKHFCPVLAQVMNAIGAEFAFLYNSMLAMLSGRTLAEAAGVNLDVLGTIVGQSRTLFNYSLKGWLQPDGNGVPVDQGLAWVEGASIYGEDVADDSVFRQLILAKIFKNHVKAASAPELKVLLKMATGGFVSFIREGPLELALAVSDSADIALLRGFCRPYRNSYVDFSYLLALPPCVRLTGFYIVPTEDNKGVAFIPDMDGHGADAGRAAIQFSLITEE